MPTVSAPPAAVIRKGGGWPPHASVTSSVPSAAGSMRAHTAVQIGRRSGSAPSAEFSRASTAPGERSYIAAVRIV